jgi:adenine-specific DNA-methyltransferase
MLIEGDNIAALVHLLHNPSIKGAVRLVYIDPPFATRQIFTRGRERTATISRSNHDATAYRDMVTGTAFLRFLRERLIVLRELMADDGSIYVHIDCKMGHYVKVVMDEVFGQNRYINDITRIKCNPKNFQRNGYGNIKDMILFYSKSENYIWNDSRQTLDRQTVQRLFPKTAKDGRRYTTTPLHAPGETANGETGKPWRGMTPPTGRHWRYTPDVLEQLDNEGLIEWSSTGNPRKIIFADEARTRGKKRQDIWEFKDNPYPSYPTEKNIDMLKTIINASSNKTDIVLDCFCGSGTSLVAAEQCTRRWIGVDNSSIAIAQTVTRLCSIQRAFHFVHYTVRSGKRKRRETARHR